MNLTEYKKYHEAFMQNNHGSTSFHTFCCILFTVQCSIYVSIQPRVSLYRQYIYEYVIIVLPMILAHTVLAEYIYLMNCVVFVNLVYQLLSYKNVLKIFTTQNIYPNDRISVISSLRGLTYLITGLCILAVDFRDFPRYLAKTERFGYSLMDTGVGLFVTMSGLVHKDYFKHSLRKIIMGNLKIVLILLILGIARFISVKQLDYQEHVTEYGVHWNFFFTIAVCKIICMVLLYLSNNALLLSIGTLISHEIILHTGLQEWVFSDNARDTFVSANREGISSCLGYISIYLFSVHIKHILMDRNVTKYKTLQKLLCGSLILWILTCWDKICPTSRTLANASYCIFIDTILVTITSITYFVMVLTEKKDNILVPLILSTINTNGLSYFLIANLFTGAINLAMRTLHVSTMITFITLNIYMITTLCILTYLKYLGLRV